jgi:glutamine synthetase
MTNSDIVEIINKHQINWVQLHFTDLLGGLRAVHYPADQFIKDDIITHGCGFDGSAVGLNQVEASDMLAIPDPHTFLILPHEEHEARILADIYDTTRKPSVLDPRNVLKKAILDAKEKGFDDIIIAPEMEFFILTDEVKNPYEPLANKGYFTPPPIDDVKDFRKNLANYLLKSNIDVKYHHHENGRYQHEIEIKPLSAVSAADFCMYFKYLSKDIASDTNMQVTFIPKLFPDESGNGMHVHVKLLHQHQNVFYDEHDQYYLSDIAKYFIGGILHHAKSIAAFANPTMNSYKRLIPHYEAPLYIAWGRHNRSSLIRIAEKKNVDLEVRNGDPSANPYLFFAALIYAGLDGIKHRWYVEPINQNIYEMSTKELDTLGIQRLPSTLLEALQELEQDYYLKETMGTKLVETYIKLKKRELNMYLSEVSDVDVKYYLHC